MKPLLQILFAVFLLTSSVIRTQLSPSPRNNQEAAICHQDLMQSYLLKGVETSNNRTVHFCPDIKKNCCTRHDQQRIFHFAKDILPLKYAEYTKKIDILLLQMREIHTELVKTPPVFTGTRNRRRFCGREYRSVLGYDFQQLYNDISEEINLSEIFLEKHYRKFFCMMCDGDAHSNMIFRENRQSVAFNIEYCQDTLKSNKELVRLLNIELINYFASVQNVVDCIHYDRSFNLQFSRMDKLADRDMIRTCLEDIQGPRFNVICNRVCQKITMAQIIPLFQGDFDFLHEVVTTFNRFLKYKENGNVISMRLRNFFKRFRIPRQMTHTARSNFLANLTIRPQKNMSGRSLRDLKLPKSKQNERKLVDLKSTSKLKGLIQSIKPKLNSKKTRMSDSLQKIVAVQDSVPPTQTLSPKAGRFLQEAMSVVSAFKKRRRHKMVREVNTPRPYFDKTLSEFYADIEIPRVETPRPTLYRIKSAPIIFDNLEKSWVEDSGINMHEYDKLRFEMSTQAFYRVLFTYRKPEMPDTKLTLFLIDFGKPFFKQAGDIFTRDYFIMPNNYFNKLTSQLEIEDDDRRRKLMGKYTKRVVVKELPKQKRMKSVN